MVRLLHFSFGLMLMRYKPVTARLYDLKATGGAEDTTEEGYLSPRRRNYFKEILYDYHRVVPVFLKEQQSRRLSAGKNRAFASEGSSNRALKKGKKSKKDIKGNNGVEFWKNKAETCQKELDELSKRAIEEPILMHKSQECFVRREKSPNGSFNYFVHTNEMDPVTYEVSYDSLSKFKELATNDVLDELEDRFAAAEVTLIMTFSDEKSSESPVFAANLESSKPINFSYLDLFEDDSNNDEGIIYAAFKVKQTSEQESVLPLSKLFEDDENSSQSYKDCTFFMTSTKDNVQKPPELEDNAPNLPMVGGAFDGTKFPSGNNDRLLDGYDLKHGSLPSPFKTVKNCTDESVDTSVEACIEVIPSGDSTVVYDNFITSASERSDFLSTAAKAEGGVMGFKASVTANYAANSKMTQNSVSYVKGATKFTTNHRIKNPENLQLTTTGERVLKESPHKFFNQYGYFFTSSITYGANFIGSFTLTAETEEADTDLKATASVSAKGGVWSVEGSASFEDQTQAQSSSMSVSSSYTFTGGRDDGKSLNAPRDLQLKYGNWSNWVDNGIATPVYLNIQSWTMSSAVQKIVLTLKPGQQQLFYDQTPILQGTTVRASKQRMETDLLIENLELLETWPTISSDTNKLAEIDAVMKDAVNYQAALQLNISTEQLYILQEEWVSPKKRQNTTRITNKFGTWLYYKTLNNRYLALVKRVGNKDGEYCARDKDCQSGTCYILECHKKIPHSKPFPNFALNKFALLFKSNNPSVYGDVAIQAAANAKTAGNDTITKMPLDRSTKQEFQVQKDGSIIHVDSKMALAVAGSTFQPGNWIHLAEADGTLAQQWVWLKDGRIANRNSGLSLTNYGPNGDDTEGSVTIYGKEQDVNYAQTLELLPV